jgi:hypothetical protein
VGVGIEGTAQTRCEKEDVDRSEGRRKDWFFNYYHRVRERTATETIQEEVNRARKLLPSNAKHPHLPIKMMC